MVNPRACLFGFFHRTCDSAPRRFIPATTALPRGCCCCCGCSAPAPAPAAMRSTPAAPRRHGAAAVGPCRKAEAAPAMQRTRTSTRADADVAAAPAGARMALLCGCFCPCVGWACFARVSVLGCCICVLAPRSLACLLRCLVSLTQRSSCSSVVGNRHDNGLGLGCAFSSPQPPINPNKSTPAARDRSQRARRDQTCHLADPLSRVCQRERGRRERERERRG